MFALVWSVGATVVQKPGFADRDRFDKFLKTKVRRRNLHVQTCSKIVLTVPGFRRLQLKHDELLSSFALYPTPKP